MTIEMSPAQAFWLADRLLGTAKTKSDWIWAVAMSAATQRPVQITGFKYEVTLVCN